jgi:hypothetical protein
MNLNKLIDAVVGLLIIAIVCIGASRNARANDLDVRASVGFEALHAQGYWTYGLRVGQDGGYGLRAGQLRAPSWSHRIPAEMSEWKLDSLNYVAADREFCGTNWCGSLGIAHLSELTKINGTKTNFLLGIRYVINPEWSLELLHFSHGSMLGIEKGKSNSGWNFLQAVYTFK